MTKLKILHIATLQGGGAGIAATRLHTALLRQGHESKFLFLDRGIPSDNVIRYRKSFYLWQLFLRILKKMGLPLTLEQKNDYAIRKYKYQFEMFSFANTKYVQLHEHHLVKSADIIHLHWISNFLDYQSFFKNINKPVVWTLHDMNAFQGGFHYKGDENRFVKSLSDLNKEQIRIKKNALGNISSERLCIVTPSNWLKQLSKESDLLGRFQHDCIPNGVDAKIFKFLNLNKAIKHKKKTNILFVSESLHNYRKGFDFVLDILHNAAILEKCNFIAVGYVRKSSQIPQITYIGNIDGEQKMSDLYNEADIFLLPSREDNLPNSMIESLCCGTPVVGFAIGGLTETISNGKNGYLSKEVSATGLANALLTCIENIDILDNKTIAAEAHRKYSTETQVPAFLHLYKKCLQPEHESTLLIE